MRVVFVSLIYSVRLPITLVIGTSLSWQPLVTWPKRLRSMKLDYVLQTCSQKSKDQEYSSFYFKTYTQISK